MRFKCWVVGRRVVRGGLVKGYPRVFTNEGRCLAGMY